MQGREVDHLHEVRNGDMDDPAALRIVEGAGAASVAGRESAA